METVSPEYRLQLQELARMLVSPERYAKVAQNAGELVLEPNITVGEE